MNAPVASDLLGTSASKYDDVWPAYFKHGSDGLRGSLQKFVAVSASQMGQAEPMFNLEIKPTLNYEEMSEMTKKFERLGMSVHAARDFGSAEEEFHIVVHNVKPEFVRYLKGKGVDMPGQKQTEQLMSGTVIDWEKRVDEIPVRWSFLNDLKAIRGALKDNDGKVLNGQHDLFRSVKHAEDVLRKGETGSEAFVAIESVVNNAANNLPNQEAKHRFQNLRETYAIATGTTLEAENVQNVSASNVPEVKSETVSFSPKMDGFLRILDAKGMGADADNIRNAMQVSGESQRAMVMDALSGVDTAKLGSRASRIMGEVEAELGFQNEAAAVRTR